MSRRACTVACTRISRLAVAFSLTGTVILAAGTASMLL
ncbi:hypothetical protein DAQ1742_02674 [Dickeya aquatica]|uniref:Uncharacterized protein n=1 Tax=Dickeya aquatica TaxID=1401087 RepID=A0A375AC32_9GAMM|nr:hypothetical protein DAQ1742_02674 [Dickeya aquatica]